MQWYDIPPGEFVSLLAYGQALHRTNGPVYYFHCSENGEVMPWDGSSGTYTFFQIPTAAGN